MCNGALAVSEELEDCNAPVLIATTTHGVWSRAPQDVHHAGKGSTWIGALPTERAEPTSLLGWLFNERPADSAEPLPPPTAEAQELFASRGLGAIIEGQGATERRLWLKLAANAVLNPLTALWDVQNGEVLRRAEGREIAEAVCEEVWAVNQQLAVSRAAAELQVSDLVAFVHECAEANALNYSSMCMDVRLGRRTEIEQLNGWIEKKSYELHGPGGQVLPLGRDRGWLGKNEELAEAIRKLHPRQ